MFTSAQCCKNLFRTVNLIALGTLVSIAHGQLTASQKSTFEKLQDTIQDDAVVELYVGSGATAEFTWELPSVLKSSFTVIQHSSAPFITKDDIRTKKFLTQTFEIEWKVVKSISLEKKTVKIVLNKKVKTKQRIQEVGGNTFYKDISVDSLEIHFPKTAQARNATNLFNSLLTSFKK